MQAAHGRKKEELKGLKSEFSAIERKIQLDLTPLEKAVQTSDNEAEQRQGTITNASAIKDHVIITQPKLSTTETYKGFKI